MGGGVRVVRFKVKERAQVSSVHAKVTITVVVVPVEARIQFVVGGGSFVFTCGMKLGRSAHVQ